MKGCMICMEHDRSGSRGVAKLLSAERNTFHIKSKETKMLSCKNSATLLDPPLLETTWVGEKQVVTASGQCHHFRFCNGVEPLVDLLNFQPFWTFAVFLWRMHEFNYVHAVYMYFEQLFILYEMKKNFAHDFDLWMSRWFVMVWRFCKKCDLFSVHVHEIHFSFLYDDGRFNQLSWKLNIFFYKNTLYPKMFKNIQRIFHVIVNLPSNFIMLDRMLNIHTVTAVLTTKLCQ